MFTGGFRFVVLCRVVSSGVECRGRCGRCGRGGVVVVVVVVVKLRPICFTSCDQFVTRVAAICYTSCDQFVTRTILDYLGLSVK